MSRKLLMNALVFHEYGSADKLKYERVTRPDITGPDDVIIRVKAAGLAHGDVKLRQGHLKYLFPMKMPAVLGMDYSGIVENVGENAKTLFKINDAVYGQFSYPTASGTFADYTKINFKHDVIIHKPINLSFEEAAGTLTSALAAYVSVIDHCKIVANDNKRVLIIGCAGSIGSWATQISSNLGAHVTGICSAIDADTCRALGASDILDYSSSYFKDQLYSKEKYDAVIDTVGGDDYWNFIEPHIVDGGVYSTQAGDARFGGDGNPLISLLSTLVKAIPRNIFGRVSYKLYTDAPKSYCMSINQLLIDGKLKCFVGYKFDLKDGADANRQIESKLTAGKIVLIPNNNDEHE
eukprot:NODE_60_length_25605_cov_0.732377.p6 type:complete len:350 gc:universal NODE_60_length_25605_cov_0.732377:5758-4709(-)